MAKARKPVDAAKIASRASWQLLLNITSNLLNKARDNQETADLDLAALMGRMRRCRELLIHASPCGWSPQQTLDQAERRLDECKSEVKMLTDSIAWLREREPK